MLAADQIVRTCTKDGITKPTQPGASTTDGDSLIQCKIIIDTDPGIDDAVAILLALAAPEELEVLGIIAVAGNLPLAQTERNARQICELAGRPDLAVYAGCARSLVGPPATAAHIHCDAFSTG